MIFGCEILHCVVLPRFLVSRFQLAPNDFYFRLGRKDADCK